MTRFLQLIRLVCCVSALAIAHPALANVLSVGNSLGCQYAKIQDAIDAAVADDVIHVEPSHTYAEHLLITDKSLTICGSACGGSNCLAKSRAVVDGAAAIKVHNPLLQIQTTGSDSITVSLSNINFSNNHSAINGGGIAWSAQGQLMLGDVLVTGNDAPNGGGIYFNGTGNGASLTFGDNVSISANNTTVDGGGVRITGPSQLHVNGNNDFIYQNTADSDGNDTGDGGGISAESPATVSLGSTGNIAVYSNTAYNGGGIALIGGSVDAGSSDSGLSIAASMTNPVHIESNTATHWGGGVYLRPKVFASATINAVHLSASGYRIDSNTAGDGSATYADTDSSPGIGDAGGKVSLDQTNCPLPLECSTIAGNLSGAISFGGTPASVVVIKAGGQLNARHVRMYDNAGEHLLQSAGLKTDVVYSLLYGNHVAGALIAADSTSQHVDIRQSTIAGNTIENASEPVISGNLETLNYCLIDQADRAAFSGSSTPIAFDIVATDTDGLPADSSIQQQAPLFIDAANDDYRLLVQRYDDGSVTASAGVDYAVSGIADIDLGSRPYNQDIPGVGADGNVRDLGAFEMRPISDRIFASGIGDPVLLVY